MPTLEELLNASNEVATCTVNPDTREIIVPEKYKILGVFSDEKVTKIPFTCPKVVGNNVDLTEYNLYINYQNAIGRHNAYLVDDVAVSGDNITFSWLLSRDVTLSSGVVKYSLCAKKLNGDSISNEWNTTIANGVVIQGLEATQAIVEENSDIIEAILSKAHTHANKSVLDKFAEANGKPTYDGKALGGGSSTELDTTLSEAGKAADAKAVGDRLSAISEDIVTTSESKVDAHNTGTDTHSDIRLLIQGLTDRLNTLADSDDTTLDQLSEVVAYIKSNRSLIEAITTDKVNVADIVDNLTTNVSNKPLSAAQGVIIKTLIEVLRNDKQDKATLEADVSAAGFTKNTGTYSRPTGGIPKADLAAAVQTSLGKADSALQSVPSIYRTAAAQDVIDSGKVDKVTGKGLSTNDYTAAAKAKVDAIPANPKYTDTVYDDTALKERVSTIEGKESVWDAKSDFSGSYNDLTDKPTLLTGTTAELTPTQVYNAVSAGIPIKVQYSDDTFGVLSYTNFSIAESIGFIAANSISLYYGNYILGELIGDKINNTWNFTTTTLAQKADIPSALPNPNALTFTGAVTGTYNGSEPLSVQIPSAVTDSHINSLIDTKLGVIENGSY